MLGGLVNGFIVWVAIDLILGLLYARERGRGLGLSKLREAHKPLVQTQAVKRLSNRMTEEARFRAASIVTEPGKSANLMARS